MKISLKELRKLIREECEALEELSLPSSSGVPAAGNGLTSVGHSQLVRYALKLFSKHSDELGVFDPSDPLFLQYISDHLSEMGVSAEKVDAVEKALIRA